ncbi:hypothetical protein GCG54_00002791 [Colletotrichum gloeosporioides]|uniref:Uncharacterized protein n=1 Tax=Colletotrichum gloeosporioides TaxID=474922 RepID=A0A8H4FKN4_COLGL|nr:uncharacterized protein GCG54_00002791 [Colletotrichum gloeosporioides]KAF3805446.1 hypothetical protein GCG54_00002791 [Colletotrichum gloeosporioides]
MDASDIDPEMAAFMGFASFGTQPAAKKRKYNHRTDAVAASDSATGANQVALATRTPSSAPAAASATSTDEITLDSDAEPDTTKAEEPHPAAAAADNNDDDEEGGASLYSDPTVAPALAHAQSLIDELTVRGGVGSAASQAQQGGAGAGDGDALPSGASLPMRPEASWGREMGAAPTSMPGRNQGDAPHEGRGGRGGARNNRHHHQQRDDGKPWWEGYYDHKSNENPWAKLEKAAGVEPRGSWALEGQAQTA